MATYYKYEGNKLVTKDFPTKNEAYSQGYSADAYGAEYGMPLGNIFDGGNESRYTISGVDPNGIVTIGNVGAKLKDGFFQDAQTALKYFKPEELFVQGGVYRPISGSIADRVMAAHNITGKLIPSETLPRKSSIDSMLGVTSPSEVDKISIPGYSHIFYAKKGEGSLGEYNTNYLKPAEPIGIDTRQGQPLAGSGQTNTTPTSSGTKLPSGVLVRDSSNNKIYFIDNGTKRHIVNENVLAGGAFVDIDPSHLTNVPEGAAITTKPSFDWKGQEEINNLLSSTGINWQQPAGYDPGVTNGSNQNGGTNTNGSATDSTTTNNNQSADTNSSVAGDSTENNGETTGSSTGAAPYGGEQLPSDVEQWTGQFIGTVLTSLKKSEGITEDMYNKIVNDPAMISKYIDALLYGEYTMDDVYRDIKIQDLVSQGNTAYSGLKGIDENIKATEFYDGAIGKQVKADSILAPNLGLSGMDASLFDNPIFKIPGQAFSTIVKPIDWNSPEFKEEAEKIQASYYDILNQNYEAKSDQEKMIAKSNWETFKTNLQEKYNINLGDNVRGAWDQLEQLFSGATEAGIGNSGIIGEATDKYLTDIRRGQDIMRKETSDTKELERRNYLMQSGSAEEIAAFVNEVGLDKATEYGFVPNADTKAFYTKENLKAQYPDMSDAEIENVINMMIDPTTGNYKSNMYQQLYANKYDVDMQKQTYQQGKLYEKKLAEEQKAYAPFTKSNPLSSYQPEYLGERDKGALGNVTGDANKTTLYNPVTKQPFQVNTSDIGSYSGWTTTKPQDEKADSEMGSSVLGSSTPWKAPEGYTRIPNPGEQKNYTDIQFDPTDTSKDRAKWGKLNTNYKYQ